MSRRETLRLLALGAGGLAATGVRESTGIAAQGRRARRVNFPKGAIIRTILQDIDPESLAGGATLTHEHISIRESDAGLASPAREGIRRVRIGHRSRGRGVEGHLSDITDDPNAEVPIAIAKRGAFVAFDTAGRRLTQSDSKKLEVLLAVIDAGYEDHVLLSSEVRSRAPVGWRKAGAAPGSYSTP